MQLSFIEEFDFLDFANVFELIETSAGLRWKVIEQLLAEREDDDSYLHNHVDYENDFSIEMLEDINTPIYTLTREQLIQMAVDIFEQQGLIDVLKVDKSVVRGFFRAMAIWYKRVPYHHFTHAMWLVKVSRLISAYVLDHD